MKTVHQVGQSKPRRGKQKEKSPKEKTHTLETQLLTHTLISPIKH